MRNYFLIILLIHSFWKLSNSESNSISDTLEIESLHIHEFSDTNEALQNQKNWNKLKSEEIDKHMGITLADVTDYLPGMHIRSMGPAPARPVYRGLSGHRVALLEDGAMTHDLSATSPDHASSIEPFTSSEIQTVKGPKVLLYSPSTIGGLVNVIRDEIPFGELETPLWMLGIDGGSVSKSGLSGGEIMYPLGDINLKGEASYRSASNTNAPEREIENTELENINYSYGAALNKERYSIGGAYRQFDSDYGIPPGINGHLNGATVNFRRKTIKLEGEIFPKLNSKAQNRKPIIQAKYNTTYYNQVEFEADNVIGAEFVKRNHTNHIEYHHPNILFLKNGVIGTELDYRTLHMGGRVFTPNTKVYQGSLFAYENWDISNSWHLEFATRFSSAFFDADTSTALIMPKNLQKKYNAYIKNRSFYALSNATSISKKLSDHQSVLLELGHTNRIPSEEELYSMGPHLAVHSFEIGNTFLKNENGVNFELGYFIKHEVINLSLAGFWNEYFNYIYHKNTGEYWPASGPDSLLIYQTENDPARFIGFEAQLKLNLPYFLIYQGEVDYVYGVFPKTNKAVPLMPPLTINQAFGYKRNSFETTLELNWHATQKRLGPFETVTNSFYLTNFKMQKALFKGINHRISFSIENLFNVTYRNHLSRLKANPEPARNFKLTYKIFM